MNENDPIIIKTVGQAWNLICWFMVAPWGRNDEPVFDGMFEVPEAELRKIKETTESLQKRLGEEYGLECGRPCTAKVSDLLLPQRYREDMLCLIKGLILFLSITEPADAEEMIAQIAA